ncbi:hypothetical protein C8Q72DRAFT_495077 [Fomitopsis betulina]|nr:hypothetical protein C8Q72DRAFT_495077 [Fomitopsis betulina]
MSAPLLVYCTGFGAMFSGVARAWSFAYLLFYLRNAVSLGLAAPTPAAASLYGVEYFILQYLDSCTSERMNPLRVERSRHLRQTMTSDDQHHWTTARALCVMSPRKSHQSSDQSRTKCHLLPSHFRRSRWATP